MNIIVDLVDSLNMFSQEIHTNCVYAIGWWTRNVV